MNKSKNKQTRAKLVDKMNGGRLKTLYSEAVKPSCPFPEEILPGKLAVQSHKMKGRKSMGLYSEAVKSSYPVTEERQELNGKKIKNLCSEAVKSSNPVTEERQELNGKKIKNLCSEEVKSSLPILKDTFSVKKGVSSLSQKEKNGLKYAGSNLCSSSFSEHHSLTTFIEEKE